MNKFYFVILLLLVSSLSVQGKKEEKTSTSTASAVPKSNNLNVASKSTGISRTNQNILEYIQLFKSLLSQALSKADFSSVRGMLSSPLSIGATAVSVLLGGIVLMAFYESPLSPLPVPPLPQAPVGRFPPENPVVAPMNGGHGRPMQRESSSFSQYYEFTPEQQALLSYLKKQMDIPQTQQPQQYFFSKSQSNYQPTRRSDGGFGYLNYFNQMQNNMRPNNPYANTYNNYNLVSESSSNKLVHSVPSSAQQVKKDAPIKATTINNNNAATDNLNTASSTGHLSIAAPPSTSNTNQHNGQILNYLNTQSNIQNNQLNVQQSGPVYKPLIDDSINEKVNLNHYAIKEENFDQKQLVHSQLSQVQFKTSPELAKIEEKLNRSSE